MLLNLQKTFRLLIGLSAIGIVATTSVAGPQPVQTFYLPLPEDQLRTSLVDLQPTRTIGQQMRTVTSMTTTRDNTIIYYDHWENGYDNDIANPVNIYSASNLGGTQIWGDNNPANGIPPGFAQDIIDADAVIVLKNDVSLPRNPSTISFDGRDKVASTKAIAMTRAQWATNPGTVLAGAVEVYSKSFLGTEYVFPIGENLSSSFMYEYVSTYVMGVEPNTTVTVDVDGPGPIAPVVRTLNEGENYFARGVLTGGTVIADKRVQVHLITGNLSNNGGNLEARWYSLLPTASWSNEYYNPVGSSGNNQPCRVFLYNPNASAMVLDIETTLGTFTTPSIPAGDHYEYTMPSNSGASFTSQGGQDFYGIVAVAAGTNNGGSSGVDNDTWDWGFSLVPFEQLTPQVVVGWGPGADDRDNNGVPDGQGSPVWVAVTKNTVVYVDYDGDASTGPLTDPNNNQYDTAFSLSRFQQVKVYDNNDSDQTGMKLYTVDGTLITAAWGQDPSTAGAGNPFFDLGTTVPPFPFPQLIKTAEEFTDNGGTPGVFEPLDEVLYTISVKNLGAVPLSDLELTDVLPGDVTYVPGTTEIGGTPYPDDLVSTPFPLDQDGVVLPDIGIKATLLITFRVTLNANAEGQVVNTAILDIGPEILIADSLSSSSSFEVINNRDPADIEFTLSDGTVVGFGPTPVYSESDDVYVTLDDDDLNINASIANTFTVLVQNTTNGDFESLTLTETGPNTGIFRNTSPLSGSPSTGFNTEDGTLRYQEGDTLFVSYTDPGDPTDSDDDSLILPVDSENKLLYLSDNAGPSLDRTDPVNAMSSTAETFLAGAVSDEATNFATKITSPGDEVVTVPVTVDGNNANRFMIISCFFENDQSNTGGFANYGVASVTVNGSPATFIATQDTSEEAEVTLYSFTAPPAGSYNVVVTMQNSSPINGGQEDSVIVAVTQYSGVDQVAPIGPISLRSGYSGNTNTTIDTPNPLPTGWDPGPGNMEISGAPGDLVYGYVASDDARNIFEGLGNTVVFGPEKSEATGDGAEGMIVSVPIAVGDNSAEVFWTFGGSDAWAISGFAIKAAGGANSVDFSLSSTLTQDFSMPTGGTIAASVFVETSDALSSPLDVGLTISDDGTPFFTQTTATATFISAGTGPNSDDIYRLDYGGVLGSDVDILAGSDITMEFVNNTTSNLNILYDSPTYPSSLSLPTSTVVDVESIEFYDDAYPAGGTITAASVGQPIYVRTTISDPFGPSDISGQLLRILDPSDVEIVNEVLDGGEQILIDSDSVTYEYVWRTASDEGSYTVEVSAEEGNDSTVTVADVEFVEIPISELDSGTPAFVEFTTGLDGPATSTYGDLDDICIRLIDLDENEDDLVAETVIVTITTSKGDSDTVTLTETGVDTGIFVACFPSATDTTNADDGDINADAGTSLEVSYVDDDDPLDTAIDNAIVPVVGAAVSVTKTLIEPSDGTVLLGGRVRYSVSVTNTGSVTLDTVELVDTYTASELSYTTASVTEDSTGVGTITWDDLGSLTSGQTHSVIVEFDALATGTISNTATANTTSGSGNPSDFDSDTVSVTDPALTLTKTLDGGARTVFYGELITYTIDIENTGNTDIASMPFVDSHSTCLEYVTATPTPDGAGGGSILWNDLGALATSASTSVSITFRVVGECDPATNRAEVLFAVDVNGDPIPPAEDINNELTTDAASIGDLVWEDTNNDGIFDLDGADNLLGTSDDEPGIADVWVFIDTDGDGVRDSDERFAVTDADGFYTIPNLADGTYTVRVDENTIDPVLVNTLPVTQAYSVTLDPGEDDDTIDFGVRRTTVTGTIFRDDDGNGADNEGIYLGGVDVVISDQFGNTQTVRTNASGEYSADVLPGTVWVNVVEATLPSGVTLTTGNEPQSITAAPGINTYTDIGYQLPQGVTGHLFIDINGNGVQDGGEPDLAGVTVWADTVNTNGSIDGGEPTAITDANGDFTLQTITGNVLIEVLDSDVTALGLDATPSTANDPQTVVVATNLLTTAPDVGYVYIGLGIIKTSDAAGSTSPNDTITYTINVINNSGSPHTGIDITDTLPTGVTYVTGSLDVDAPTGYPIVSTLDITETFPSAGDPTTGSPTSGVTFWAGDWTEIVEVDGFGTGLIQILNDPVATDVRLYIGDATDGADRAVDLGSTTAADISFTYRFANCEGESVFVQLSNDNGSSFPLTLLTLTDDNNDGNGDQEEVVTNFTIPSAYLTSSTVIRFISDAAFFGGGSDEIYIDDITIATTYDDEVSQTGTIGNFPTNTEIGNDYLLDDGQAVTITYRVTVDDPPGVGSIDNTASVVSTQQPVAVDSSTSDTVVTPPAVGSITGFVLEDTTGSGTGTLAIENVRVELLDSGGNSIDRDAGLPGVQPTYDFTDSSGQYSFEDITPGNYQISQTQPSGFVSVAAIDDGGDVNILGDVAPIVVLGDTENSGNDFFEQQPATIAGFVLEDFDGNGTGDIPIAGVVLELRDATNNPIDSDLVTPGIQATTVTTGFTGRYAFSGLTPGVTYQVRQIQPSGYNSISDFDGGLPNRIGDITPITPVPGINDNYNFIEEVILGSISGTVLDDTDGDAIGDAGIDGVTVYVDLNNNNVFDPAFDVSAVTAGGGNYTISNLRPGNYAVREVDPGGYVSITDTDGGDANETAVSLAAGQNETGIDFVDGLPASINGEVIDDVNGNGVDDSESGIDGVTIELYEDLNGNGLVDFNEVLLDTTVTAGGGLYSFSNLPAGDYVIQEIDPVNFLSTNDSDAPNDNQIGLSIGPGSTNSGNVFLDSNQGSAVQVTKTLNGGSQTAFANQLVTYTILIENVGNTEVDTLPLEDSFNANVLKYVSASIAPDTVASGSVVWNDLGNLPIAGNVSFTVTLQVIGNASPATNTATVSGAVDEFANIIPDASDDDILLTADVGSIAGQVWEDDDGNGTLNGGEAGFSGIVIVFLDIDQNGTRGPSEPFDVVDGNGDYLITGLEAGTYDILVDESTLPSPPSYARTFPLVVPRQVTLLDGEDVANEDFGYQPQIGDLAITKTPSPVGTVTAGGSIDYTITITNNDTVTHTNINVTDNIPTGTTFNNDLNIVAPATYTTGFTVTNITEDWETDNYTGGTPTSGSPAWNGNWAETFDSGGGTSPNNGDTQLVTDLSDISLRVDDGSDDNEGVTRTLNLSALASTDTATLSFDWRVDSTNLADDTALVQIRPQNSGPWTTLQEVGFPDTATYQTTSGIGISNTFFTATAQFRLRPSNIDTGLEENDFVYFDNIQITTNVANSVAQTGAPGAPPNIATNYGLNPGESITITYSVTVDTPWPNISLVQNTASLTSTQQPGPIIANAFNAVSTGAVSGFVLQDTDGDGSGDLAIASVTVELLDEFGASIDSDSSTPGVQPVTTTTNAFGEYFFENVPTGNYQVFQTQPGGFVSVSDTDGFNNIVNNTIGDESPIVVTLGNETSGNLFVEALFGQVSGTVFEDVNFNGVNDSEAPLAIPGGITVELVYDANNNGIVDGGDYVYASTLTDPVSGDYAFSNVAIGNYLIREVDPTGYFSTGDSDAPNDNLIDLTMTDGLDLEDQDFLDASLTQNDDGDCTSDFLEYMLGEDIDNGVVDPATWFQVKLINEATGRIDVEFRRPTDTYNVTYVLQAKNNLLDGWSVVATIPANAVAPAPFSTVDNLDGTETITYGNIQNAGIISSPDFGLVRLTVEYGTEGPQATDTLGWEVTDMTLDECNSFSNSFAPQEIYCGVVDATVGNDLILTSTTSGADLSALITPDDYYIEVRDGAFEGARFQIASSGAADEVTLYNDADLYSPSPVDSLNTRTGVPDLTGSEIAIRAYRTFGGMFDKTTSFAGQSSGDFANATHIYIYNNRLDTPILEPYVLANISGDFVPFLPNISAAGDYWIREDDVFTAAADQDGRLIDPNTGFLIIPKQAAPILYSLGKVRSHDADSVLNTGYNLVGAMYPLDQVPLDEDADFDGRNMNDTVFTQANNLDDATELLLWETDPEIAPGQVTSFSFIDDGATVDYWTDFADMAFPDVNDDPAELLIHSNRAIYIKLPDSDQFTHTHPQPGFAP